MSAPILSWPTGPERFELDDNEVHVRAAALDVADDALSKLATTLADSELDRAARFKFEQHRNRFITGRGLLRVMLGQYLRADPAALDLVYSNRGKPSPAPPFEATGIHFNVAHSDGLALFAFTRTGPVGVDVERIRVVKDVEDLVARFFSTRESEQFRKLAAGDQPSAFFNLWTRKEAMLKATGEGITQSLSLIEVSFLPGEPARVLRIGGDAAPAARWHLEDLSPAPGFVGALAVEAQTIRAQCWRTGPPQTV